MVQDIEQELRAHFARRLEGAEPSLPPVAGVLDQSRRERRRRALMLAVAITVAAATVLALLLAPAPLGLRRGESPSVLRTKWTPLTVPTAGDLATDRDWIRQATSRVAALTHGRLSHVIFAGRLPVGAAVLAALSTDVLGEGNVQAFYSPGGTAAGLDAPTSTWSGTGPAFAPPSASNVSLTVAGPDGARYYVVVPLVPVHAVEVSAGPQVGSDGRVIRTWVTSTVRDGAAVGRSENVTLNLPRVRFDGGFGSAFLFSPLATAEAAQDAYIAQLAARWGAEPAPSRLLLQGALVTILWVARPEDITVVPVFHGREQPSTAETLAAVVRLRDGGALQVAALLDDRKPDQPTLQTPLVGQAVPARTADRVPIAWLDDVSYRRSTDVSGGRSLVMRARVRVVQPGADRIVIRDTGATPCAPRRDIAAGPSDPGGLTTFVVDVPARCQDPQDPSALTSGYSRIQAIAYDEAGVEIGRSPIQLSTHYQVADSSDRPGAVARQ